MMMPWRVLQVYAANQHPAFPEGGKMSQYLDALKVGDSITIKGPVSFIC